jgi:hypothetical protein
MKIAIIAELLLKFLHKVINEGDVKLSNSVVNNKSIIDITPQELANLIVKCDQIACNSLYKFPYATIDYLYTVH